MDKKPLPPGFQSREIQSVELPNPSSFRQLRPAILGDPPVSVRTRLFERRRVIVGVGIAAALHVSLGLAWWLMPPLRLKAGIDPKRWVQVVSVPATVPGTRSGSVPDTSRAKAHQTLVVPIQKPSPSADPPP